MEIMLNYYASSDLMEKWKQLLEVNYSFLEVLVDSTNT